MIINNDVMQTRERQASYYFKLLNYLIAFKFYCIICILINVIVYLFLLN